jgi:sulfur carrier protein ThiS
MRAGGPTKQAYLFGLEFARLSTRQRQRQALDDALRRLEASLGSAGVRQAANLSDRDPAAAARLQAADEEARRAQLNRLRSLQPNGRIALELEPSAIKLEDLPDVPLEDGDSLFLPATPGFVFAVGAVSNENAILWRANRTVGQYLAAAGVSPEADTNNIFVVRADGSVVHGRETTRLLGGNRISELRLAPGDTVVVPDLTNRETPWNAFVRGAKDWTQILSNFGLAAAAIKTLRN